jgi:DNA-binding response OmpR family regulator
MKKPSFRRVLREFSSFLLFFLSVGFVVSCCMMLFLRIGALLRRSKIASSRRLEVGNFVMDADERSAALDGEEISLTAREFDLLFKLLSYPKKTFTRTQLMDEF